MRPDPDATGIRIESLPELAVAELECLLTLDPADARRMLHDTEFDAVVVEFDPDRDAPEQILDAIGPPGDACGLVARCPELTERQSLALLERGFHECVDADCDGHELLTAIRRARARGRVAAGNSLMAAIVGASPDTIFSVDRDGIITSFNSGAERLFGYSAQQAIGRHVSLLTAGEQTAEQDRWYRRLLEGEAFSDQWTTRTRADGSLVEVSVTSSPIFDSDGGITGFCSVMRDISGLVGGRGHMRRQHRLLSATQSAAKVGSWEYDIHSAEFSWSDEMYRLWGMEPDQTPILYSEMLERIHPDDRSEMVSATARWLRSPGMSVSHEYRIVRPSGEVRTLLVRGLHVHAPDGGPGRLLGTAIDVTDQRAEHEAELRTQRQFRQSFEDAPAPMWIAALDGTLSEVNDALCGLLARPREQLLGCALSDFLHPDDHDGGELARELLETNGRASATQERRFLHSDGHVIWAIVGMTLIRAPDNTPLHVVGHAQDITSRRRYEERLRHMADHDPLTGLLNRRGFDRELRRHVSHISRYGAAGALLVIDLDNFKQFNDTYGHTAGDNLITTISRGLHGRLRANDVIGRLGGDEFAVLLPEADRDQAEAVAVALLDYVREAPLAARFEAGRSLTTSVGIYSFQGDGPFSKDRAMIAADRAMYDAKNQGRNRYSHYDAHGGSASDPLGDRLKEIG